MCQILTAFKGTSYTFALEIHPVFSAISWQLAVAVIIMVMEFGSCSVNGSPVGADNIERRYWNGFQLA